MEKFSDLMQEIGTLKEKVTKLYLVTPYSSQHWSPNTNVIGFLDSVVRNLKKLLEQEVNLNYIPSLKYMWRILFTELQSLRPLLLEYMMELQDGEHNEVHGLWREMMGMIYNADYVIKIRLLWNFSAWYVIVALPYVINHMKCVKGKINNHNKKKPGHLDHMEEIVGWRTRGTTSEIGRNYTSFVEEETAVIDELTRGQSCLTVISISGSGGQGKTTFAKQIYNDPKVRYHFHKTVWCYISKDCPVREILVQIKGGANYDDVKEMTTQDVVEAVRKSFKRRRYLAVMDDIWDVDAWSKLESSFPDDKNGSRILFTSRNHDLASQVKQFKSITHPLPIFSDEKSWDLMKKMIFGSDKCDEEFLNLGRKIASYCKGLPLAVVLIAGVLGRTKLDLDSWKKVVENMKSHLTLEGCGNVIELSYTYLSDHLKSCFLYFGVYKRGESVRAKELKLLWMGEGFVAEEDLATEYLRELVAQGLVTVTEKSSMGGIKRCNVHDLLYDLCLEKCKENNFLYWTEKSTVASTTSAFKYSHHRLQIGVKEANFIQSSPLVNKRELPTSSLHSLLWLGNRFSVETKISLRFLGSFKLVTVLKLTKKIRMDEFPEVVLSIIHLTYLELHFFENIRAVPWAIATLLKLGTLIIDRQAYFERTLLPVSMLSMKSLKNVHINNSGFFLKGSSAINYRNVSNIEALGSLILDEDDSSDTEFLQNFPRLRKLSCKLSGENGNFFKWLSRVGSLLTQLQSLKVKHEGLYWKYQNPVIWNISELQNLKKLTLEKCMFAWNFVSEIGKKLPNLRILKLIAFFCEARSWKLEDGDFSKLTYLKMHRLAYLEEIDVSSCEDPPFPCLEHLVVKHCEDLQEIPFVFGEICGLKTIHLIGCKAKVTTSAMEILEDRTEFGNHGLQVMVKDEKK